MPAVVSLSRCILVHPENEYVNCCSCVCCSEKLNLLTLPLPFVRTICLIELSLSDVECAVCHDGLIVKQL